MPSPLLLPVLTVSVVLLLSGWAKLRDPGSLERAFTSLEVPGALSAPLVRRLVPWAEIALGAWLLLATGSALVAVAALSLLLFVAYLVLVVRAVRRPEPADCGCFGAIGDSRVTAVTVWRNVALVASAALAVVAGTQGVGLVGTLAEGSGLGWIAMAALTAVVAVLVTWRPGGTESETPDASHGLVTVDEDGEYVRERAPLLTFLDEDGQLLALEHSVVDGAHLLVFLSRSCSPCLRIVPHVPDWAVLLHPVRVKAVVIGSPSSLEGDLEVLRGHTWFDPWSTARRQVSARTPGAVLVGADGLLAGGPVSGERDVKDFVEEIAVQLREAGVLEAESAPASASQVSDDR